MRLVLRDLPRLTTISDAVRPKYFKEGGKLPSSLAKNLGLYYTYQDGILIDIHTGEAIVSNPKQAGEPSTVVIKGNLLWHQPSSLRELQIKKSHIAKIKEHLVGYFISKLKDAPRIKVKPESFPLEANLIFIVKTFKDEQDIDNLDTFYRKSFLDAIQHEYFVGRGKKLKNPVGFIPEDSPRFVCKTSSAIYMSNKVKHTDLIINVKQHDKIILADRPELAGLDY